MTGKTHDLAAFTSLVGVIIWLPTLPPMSIPTAIVAFSANFIGGLFPDIDQPTSDLWDNFRFGPAFARVFTYLLGGHRHLSHSLIGMWLIGFLLDLFLRMLSSIVLIDMKMVWYSFMIGAISHVVMDMFTKAGVPLFWPLKYKVGFPPFQFLRIQSNSFIENRVIFPGLILFTLYLLYLYQIKFFDLLNAIF